MALELYTWYQYTGSLYCLSNEFIYKNDKIFILAYENNDYYGIYKILYKGNLKYIAFDSDRALNRFIKIEEQ